ncbi:MAG: YXWGXW repeat-containing protein [Terriglobales bacterium]
MRTKVAIRAMLYSFVLLALFQGAFAQVGISVSFGPPALPVYEQPICPADGYLWAPGYWDYDDYDGYYWVPGTWVEPPQVGYLWTPGYWGWDGNAFLFHEGYWGPQVGFYGGIDYGFGYGGVGYDGGRWEGDHFSYNTYVTHVNPTLIHNTYNTRVGNASETRISYNGGAGGVDARPTPRQESYDNEHHAGPVAAQTQHRQEARGNPELRASTNHGKPPIAATAKPSDFKTGVVAARQAGGEYKAPPPNAVRGNGARPGNEARPTETRPENTTETRSSTYNHAGELPPHKATPPNTGNAATDRKYQEQQDKLAAKQTKDHEKLQQQQEKEHQQAAKNNYNDAQKQQMEQRHAQQTQQLEQKHATQERQMEQRQAPRQTARPEKRPPEEKPH